MLKKGGLENLDFRKDYYMIAGGIIIVLTIIISGLSGLYKDNTVCKQFAKDYEQFKEERSSGDLLTEESIRNLEMVMRCSNVGLEMFMSYLFISVGVAFVFGGFITR